MLMHWLISYLQMNNIYICVSPRHLTYRGLGRAILLHALQTTNMVFRSLVGMFAHFFRSSIMHFESNNETAAHNHEGAIFITV